MSSKPKQKQEQYYRVDITRYPPLSTDAELAMFASYRKRRTAKKREAIVKQYLYWAAELACRYCGPRMPKVDALSAANYGLMQAIEKFDPSEGKRFVTYSYFAIRREVLYALRDSYVVNPASGLAAARYKFMQSERTQADAEEFKTRKQEIYADVHAPAPIAGPKGNLPDDDREELTDGEDLRDSVQDASLLETLRAALPSLPEELRTIITLCYFNEGKPLSFVAIGAKLGHTPDHVRWLHGRALQSLRKILRPVRKEY